MSRKSSKPIDNVESAAEESAARTRSKSAQASRRKSAAENSNSKEPVKNRTKKSVKELAAVSGRAEKSTKKSTSEKQPSSKTPQVMRLVEQRRDVNPVILAGKSAIPRQLRGVEPLSRIMKREAAIQEEGALIDLTAQLAEENALPILRRFNACGCEKCAGKLAEITREKLPARFVRSGAREYDEIKEQLRKAVMTQMIRELLGSKRRSFHE